MYYVYVVVYVEDFAVKSCIMYRMNVVAFISFEWFLWFNNDNLSISLILLFFSGWIKCSILFDHFHHRWCNSWCNKLQIDSYLRHTIISRLIADTNATLSISRFNLLNEMKRKVYHFGYQFIPGKKKYTETKDQNLWHGFILHYYTD